jgi:hypothetical protein
VVYKASLWNPNQLGSITRWRYHTEALEKDGDRILGRSPRSTVAPNQDAGLIARELVKFPSESPQARLITALQEFRIYSPTTHFLRYSDDPTQQDPVGLLGGGLGVAVGELLMSLRKDPKVDYGKFAENVHRLIGWADHVLAVLRDRAPLPASVTSSREVLGFRDRYMAKGRDTLTAHDASEGALYVLFGLTVGLHPRSPMVAAIDNFDQALNPKLAKAFASALCTWTRVVNPDRQLLLTCHNPLVLDGLPLAEDPTIRLFAVDRDNRGHTVVRHLDVATLLAKKQAQASPMPLSRLWVMGALGGIPDV